MILLWKILDYNFMPCDDDSNFLACSHDMAIFEETPFHLTSLSIVSHFTLFTNHILLLFALLIKCFISRTRTATKILSVFTGLLAFQGRFTTTIITFMPSELRPFSYCDFFAYQVVLQTQLCLRSLHWIDILLERDKSLIVSEHSTVSVMFWLYLALFVVQYYLHSLSSSEVTLGDPESSTHLFV
jgi:hypothetical protein